MKTLYEDVTMPPKIRSAIDAAATQLLTIEPETRAEAAKIISEHGLATHVGGHHVAIHRMDSSGAISGPRLAIVTHAGSSDWD